MNTEAEDPVEVGRWEPIRSRFHHLPVHMALLHTGRVLAFGGSGNYPPDLEQPFRAEIWTPEEGGDSREVVENLSTDVFCSGHAFLSDGRLLVSGGTRRYDRLWFGVGIPPFRGTDCSYIFDPTTEAWTRMPDMSRGRWYPTLVGLPDGAILALAGLSKYFPWYFRRSAETFEQAMRWETRRSAGRWLPLYPRVHLVPGAGGRPGGVFYAGSFNTHYTFPFERPFLAPGAEQRTRSSDLRFFHWQRQPFMPVEFSVAAYRFGHSMIRDDYKINDTVPKLPIFSADPNAGALEDFRGFRPLPAGWTIDWQFFFESGDGSRLQMARKIDAKLSLPTFTLPGLDPAELAFRNLLRGKRLGLPSGQRVALAMGIPPLGDDELGAASVSSEFVGHAPLWFYVLKEAELGGGETLGPVGGRIVAEVLLGLLTGDPLSYVNVEPNWMPTLIEGGAFTMADLIRFVG